MRERDLSANIASALSFLVLTLSSCSDTTTGTSTATGIPDDGASTLDSQPSSDSENPSSPDPKGLQLMRRMQVAFCNFQRRCAPTTWLKEASETCVDRGMVAYEIGLYGVPSSSEEGAADCYDALSELPCAELEFRDTDEQDQHQWFRQHVMQCDEFVHYSCISDSECAEGSSCTGKDDQCGECRWSGGENAA